MSADTSAWPFLTTQLAGHGGPAHGRLPQAGAHAHTAALLRFLTHATLARHRQLYSISS